MRLYEEIKNGKAKIAVYGLGQIGSAIAAVWLRKGAYVIGIDKSDHVIKEANNGFQNSKEPGVKEAFTIAIKEGRFLATNDGNTSKDAKIKFIAVPLLNNGSSINYSSLEDVADSIGKVLKKDDIICVNTSVPPGTTEYIILPRLIKHNSLKPDDEFALIYSPERVYIGRAIKDIEENYPAIISGIGNKSKQIANELYSIIAKKGVITMSSIKAAELEKLIEGVYRDINIALANELAILCDKLNIDFWEVREAANSQPYCNIHKSGIGVGGICIPIYPMFVLDVANKVKVNCNMISNGRILNNEMPIYCAREAMKILNGNKNVTVLGLAYRGNVSDARLSPAYIVIEEFLKHDLKIKLHDPYVNDDVIPKNVEFTRDIREALRDSNLIFIATDHDEYKMLDEDTILNLCSKDVAIYDGRGILSNKRFKKVRIYGIGRAKDETLV